MTLRTTSVGKNSLLQVVDGHVLELNLLGTVDVIRIGENAQGHARAGNVGEPATVVRPLNIDICTEDSLDGTRETLITLRVVVFEANLELNGLHEVSLLLAVGFGEELFNGAPHA